MKKRCLPFSVQAYRRRIKYVDFPRTLIGARGIFLERPRLFEMIKVYGKTPWNVGICANGRHVLFSRELWLRTAALQAVEKKWLRFDKVERNVHEKK